MRRVLVGTVGALAVAGLVVAVPPARADEPVSVDPDRLTTPGAMSIASARAAGARLDADATRDAADPQERRTAASETGPVPARVRNLSAAWVHEVDEIWVSWDDAVDADLDDLDRVQVSVDGEVLGLLEEYANGVAISGAPAGPHEIGIAAGSTSGAVGPVAVVPVVVDGRPANDDFARRMTLSGDWGSVWASTWQASAEAADPSLEAEWPDSGGASVWFSWTAPRSGWTALRGDTLDWDMPDPALGVFTGSTLSGLRRVPRAEAYWWQERSRFFFSAVAGTTYVIVADGYPDDELGTGVLALEWEQFDQVLTTTTLAAVAEGRRVTLSATVGSAEGEPVGTVSFHDGDSEVGSVEVRDGVATLTLTAVHDGRHAYTATFVPEDEYDVAPSTSSARLVTIAPAAAGSRTTVTAPRTVRAGSRPTVRVAVRRGTAAAAGSVVLSVGTRRVSLALRHGAASYQLAKVRPGKVRLTVAYAGNATTAASSATATITVRKKR